MEGKEKKEKKVNGGGTIVEKIGFGEKFAYGLGDFGTNMAWQMVTVFLLFYLTDVFGIGAAFVGTMLLINRIWDAINDPIMGWVADRTKTRWGSYRPYILFGAFPFALFLFLLFLSPNIEGVGKNIYVFVMYFFLVIFFTLVSIPISAMVPTMTRDLNQRSQLSSARMIGMSFAMLVVSGLTPNLISSFGTPATSFRVISIIYGAIAIISFIILFRFTKERYPVSLNQRMRIKDIWNILRKNGPLFIASLAIFTSFIMFTVRNTAVMYYFKYLFGNEAMAGIYFVIQGVSGIIGLLIGPAIAKKVDKKNTYYIGMGIFIAAGLIWFFVGNNLPMVFVLGALSAFGFMMTSMAGSAMGADTVEYAEWKTGIRGAGVLMSVPTFFIKLASGIGGALVGYILAWVSYMPDVTQTQKSLDSMVWMMTLLPVIGGITSIIIISFYRLDKNLYSRICNDLRSKKENC